MADSLKLQLLNGYDSMWTEQSSWRDHWQQISEHMQPRRARFYDKETNRGDKRNQKIINNTPLIAGRVAAAGMMAGLTSPARQWYRLVPSDPDLGKRSRVRQFLFRREALMNMLINKSNLYNTLSGAVYPDLLYFGTHASFYEEDVETFVRFYPQAIGEYVLRSNSRGTIDTFARKVPFTARQLVQKFGLGAVSAQVKEMYEKGIYDRTVQVIHFVCPNKDYSPHLFGSKKFSSIWFEANIEDPDKLLKRGGYNRFPVLAPRWALTNSVSDVYGFSPGMDALGDCKELQHLEKSKASLVDKMKDPTLAIPEDMSNQRISLVPGDYVLVPRIAQGQKIEPIQNIAPGAFAGVKDLINDCATRISQAFYADLWLQIINDDRTQPRTAREIAERHEEKMLQLGPVVQRSEDELLDPAVDFFYGRVDELELQEPAPPELQGAELKIEYISVMAQAQRLVNFSSTERFVSFTLGFAQAKPDVLDNLDGDAVVQDMGAILGTNPSYLKDPKAVAQERAERAKQNQAAQQGDAMERAAAAGKDASQTDPSKIAEFAQMVAGQAGAAQAGFTQPGGMPMK